MPERLPTRRMLRYSSSAIGALGAWPVTAGAGSAVACAGAAAGVGAAAAVGVGFTGGWTGFPPHDIPRTTPTSADTVIDVLLMGRSAFPRLATSLAYQPLD